MRFQIATASLLASTAAAFSDSSPFVLFSTSKLALSPPDTPQLQSASQVQHTAHDILASCPTTRYLLVLQPMLHASDLRHPVSGKCFAPNLCEASTGRGIQGRFDVAEVVGGHVDPTELSDYVKAACAEKGAKDGPSVEIHRLGALPREKDLRSAKVAENDFELGQILSRAASAGGGDDNGYTVVYFAPQQDEDTVYESDFVSSPYVQMELRRSVDGKAPGPRPSSAPLFVKYQFFTPGIFMGILTVLVMLALLWVGLSAVSSLQVPYGAFDKEMGPAAQKKNI